MVRRGHDRGAALLARSANRAMNSVPLVALPIAVLATCIWFDRYCLRQLANARMLLYLTDQQWRAVICLLTPIGGAAFLVLEQAR